MARRRQRPGLRTPELPDALLLDSEGLSAAATGDLRVRAEISLAERLARIVQEKSVKAAVSTSRRW